MRLPGLGIWLLVAALWPRAALAAAMDDPPPLVANPNHARIERFARKGAGIGTVEVDDRRGVGAQVLGTSVSGMHPPKTIRLDRPVADFVQAAFARMLGSAPPGAPRVLLSLERFAIEQRGRLFGSTRVYLDARIAVAVADSGGPAPVGWLEYFESKEVTFSARGKQSDLLHAALVGIATALDRGSLPLDPRGSRAGALPTVRLGLSGLKLDAARDQLESRGARSERQIVARATVRAWAGSQMSDAYGEAAYGVAVDYGEWFRNGQGIRTSMGWFSAEGAPQVIDPAWTIHSSSLRLGVLPIEATWLHAFSLRGSNLLPYAGLGIAGFLGLEDLNLDAERGIGTIQAEAGGFRASFGAHALLGLQIGLPGPFCLVAEGSWTQAGLGTTPRPHLETQEDQALWDTMFSIVRLPTFDHTGFAATIGIGPTER
uniref:Bacterial surface antigen (D15) domain-containing protein n=1 Tax=Eiseniibacteriota bacterium TaxID=2212470 RepID=A0A832MIX3_UNCEI